jgi:predicted ester cyclase
MEFMANEARRVLPDLPMRQPKRLALYNMLVAYGERERLRETTVWLHQLHGDPMTGKTKREYRQELGFGKHDEDRNLAEMVESPDRELEVEVEIGDPPHRGMPLAYLEGLSDMEFNASSQTIKENVLVTRWEVEGTHGATLLGVPPTGRRISLAGITWIAFEEKQNPDGSRNVWATGEWTYWDLPSLMEQIGASP